MLYQWGRVTCDQKNTVAFVFYDVVVIMCRLRMHTQQEISASLSYPTSLRKKTIPWA